ncbi:MAG TPA: hypothetical protein VEY12_08785 [Thermoplasmata archaeon]|nr:hypothetical protein [Thermoplasmata archaeon]
MLPPSRPSRWAVGLRLLAYLAAVVIVVGVVVLVLAGLVWMAFWALFGLGALSIILGLVVFLAIHAFRKPGTAAR